MEPLRPNTERAKIAIITIWISLLMYVVSFISGYFQYNLLQDGANGLGIDMNKATNNDVREQIVAILSFLVMIFSAAYFIMWFRRAYYNLSLLVNNLNFSDGWAAGSWFVPFIHLVRPYTIMKELYEESRSILTKKGFLSEEDLSSKYLGYWWTLWIIVTVVDRIGSTFFSKADTMDEYLMVTKLDMATNLLAIPLCLITIKVIRDYSEIEPILAENIFGQDHIDTIGEPIDTESY